MPHINIRCRASTKSKGDLVRMQKDGKIKSYNCSIEAILATEMGFLSSLKGKKIKFNLKPLSKSKNLKENNKNFVDFHLDITKKIDKVINENEKANNQQERQPETNIDFVEIRKNWLKGPISPEFKTDPQGNPIFNEVNIGEDLFEIVSSPEFGSNINREDLYEDTLVTTVEKTNNEECKNMLIDEEKQGSQKWLTGLGKIKIKSKEKPNNEEYKNILIDEEKQDSQKWLMGLGKIKIKSKDKPKKEIEQEKTPKNKNEKHNGYTTIKKDLENTKKELEQKKKEIEEIEKLAKQKESEFKKKEEEKKIREKLRKKELKKQQKLEKIKQKEREKEEKKLLAEQKKKEKLDAQLKLKEEKKLLAEQKKKEKIKLEQELKKQKLLEEQKMKEKLEAEQQLKKEKIKQEQMEKEKMLLAEKKKESEKQVQPPETTKDYDDLIETVAKKEIATDTKSQEKEIEEKSEIKTKVTETPELLDEDVRKVLIVIDNLLEKLPEETIDEFVNSKDFAVYEKVVNKYKNK